MKYQLGLLALACVVSLPATAAEKPSYRSNYTGQETRSIKSLSDDDIKQLQRGQGWGLAKAAELNGLPGPAHILQMKQEISLTGEQQAKIQAMFDDMKAKAIPLGKRLIKLEKKLNDEFANNIITDVSLRRQLDGIYKVLAELRYVHLAAHLETPKVLTAHQIKEYNRLRGYKNSDPCNNIPKGHDAQMWKQHNGCQ